MLFICQEILRNIDPVVKFPLAWHSFTNSCPAISVAFHHIDSTENDKAYLLCLLSVLTQVMSIVCRAAELAEDKDPLRFVPKI